LTGHNSHNAGRLKIRAPYAGHAAGTAPSRASRATARTAPRRFRRGSLGDENGDVLTKMQSLTIRCWEFRPTGRLRVKSHFTDLLAFPHESSEIRS
jgi:hypothetical protein